MSNISRFIGNERGDGNYQENDGCPTEVAVLKRFWREMQAARSQDEEVSDLVEFLDNENVPCEDNLKLALSITGRVKQYVGCKTEELREQVEKLTKERDALVDAIDNEMVVTHMGVFNLGDDPKVALNKICCYEQDLGKFFAEDACKEQLAALAEQNEKMRKALTKWRYLDSSYNWRCGHCGNEVEDGHKEGCALSLPNLATPALNKIKGNK